MMERRLLGPIFDIPPGWAYTHCQRNRPPFDWRTDRDAGIICRRTAWITTREKDGSTTTDRHESLAWAGSRTQFCVRLLFCLELTADYCEKVILVHP